MTRDEAERSRWDFFNSLLAHAVSCREGSIVEEALDSLLAAERLKDEPVFHWLGRGHKAMRDSLHFESECSNLCLGCIGMLTALCEDGNPLKAV